MNALILAPMRNTPGKKDADEFRREARAFCKANGLREELCLFDNGADLSDRRADVLRHVQAAEAGLDVVVFACHGWPDGVQAGFRCEHVRGLARELKEVAAPVLTVLLYCCSTGADQDPATDETAEPGPGGDGGFADRLRDELGALGVQATVYAHSTAGHCTRNPRVRIFLPHERAGGHWVVSPDSPLWPKWRQYLQGDGRFTYPFLSAAELEAELRD